MMLTDFKDKMLHENLSVNESGHLCIGGPDTVELANKYSTPLYVIDEDQIRKNVRTYINAIKESFGGGMALFASKALSFTELYRIIASEGMGIDVVSSGELFTAINAGFPLEKAFFHGNNKTYNDIEFAIKNGIGYFVVDNTEELDDINDIAKRYGIRQRILLRITPGIDPHTHAKISTGGVDSKFGSAIATGQAEEICRYALSLDSVKLDGFHCHVGSQIFESTPFCDAADIMLEFIANVKSSLGYEARILNLGGGFGVRYVESDPELDCAATIKELAEHIKLQCERFGIKRPTILLEPGRSIVANAGLTLYTVGSVKEICGYKTYVSVDGGMPDNPRYALYQSAYTALVANKATEKRELLCSIAGRCCESGDLIAENIYIQKARKNDILAVLVTGAYNYSMASNYNRLPRPPIVIVKDGEDRIGVARESLEHLVALDI